jgi:hypothetical protein
MDAGIIAMPTMVIEAMDVEVMTVAVTGEVTPDHVVTGKITTSIATAHNAQGSPTPATDSHSQSDTLVIPDGQTTSTQTAGGSGATPVKARANAAGWA